MRLMGRSRGPGSSPRVDRRLRFVVLLALALVATPAPGEAESSTQLGAGESSTKPGDPKKDASTLGPNVFLEEPLLSRARLSPDGKQIAAIYSRKDDQRILIYELQSGEVDVILRFPDPNATLSWLDWVRNDRLVFGVDIPFVHAVGVRARATQIYGIRTDGKKSRFLAKRWPDQSYIQYQDRVIDMLPDDPKRVLVQVRHPRKGGLGVYRLNVNKGTRSKVVSVDREIEGWMTDQNGVVRAGGGWEDHEQVMVARLGPDDDFFEISRVDTRLENGLEPVGFGFDDRTLYVRATHEGRMALFEYDLQERKLGRLLFAHPRVDVTGDLQVSRKRKVVEGVHYVDDAPEIHFFDEEAERLQAALDRALPGRINRIVDTSHDQSRMLLRSYSDTAPASFYIFIPEKRELWFVFSEHPELDDVDLAPMRPIRFTARDGMEIPGYLTLPLRTGGAKPGLLVYVHGGPWSRDVLGFDPFVQLLASRGLAVLQINYRGSTGYGDRHMELGLKRLGLEMQDDITDGVQWAVSEGYVDPDRVAIYGASYGGYASMMGLVKTPDLYRCGASYAGVMDLITLLKDDKRYRDAYEFEQHFVGDLSEDDERLKATSPYRQADKIEVPVLIGHGSEDPRVHVKHSERMAKRLEKLGKDVELHVYEDEIHGWNSRGTRIDFEQRLLDFLLECTAPRERAKAAPAASGSASPD